MNPSTNPSTNPDRLFKKLIADADTYWHTEGDMTSSDLLQSFYLSCRIRNLRPATMRCYSQRLGYLVKYAQEIAKPIQAVDRKDIGNYILSIIDKVSPETVNGRIRVFRLFYSYLLSENDIAESPMERIRLLKTDHKPVKVLRPEQLKRLVSYFTDKTPTGLRNKIIVLTLLDTGIRSGELINIKVAHVDLTGGTILIPHTKSRRYRYVPIAPRTAHSLHRYISKKHIDSYLFPLRNGRQMSTTRVHSALSRAGDVLGFNIYPHLIRHTGSTIYTENGGHIAMLQRILGHSDIRTTMRYVHISSKNLAADHYKYSAVESVG